MVASMEMLSSSLQIYVASAFLPSSPPIRSRPPSATTSLPPPPLPPPPMPPPGRPQVSLEEFDQNMPDALREKLTEIIGGGWEFDPALWEASVERHKADEAYEGGASARPHPPPSLGSERSHSRSSASPPALAAPSASASHSACVGRNPPILSSSRSRKGLRQPRAHRVQIPNG